MQHVLIIDDERFFATKYIRELEGNYRITFQKCARDGIAVLEGEGDIDALVLDIQMPTPAGVAAYETGDGVDTGIWLLRAYRNVLLKRSIPIIILTNRRLDDLERVIGSLRFPVGRVELFYKPDVSPQEFARRLTTILGRFGRRRTADLQS